MRESPTDEELRYPERGKVSAKRLPIRGCEGKWKGKPGARG